MKTAMHGLLIVGLATLLAGAAGPARSNPEAPAEAPSVRPAAWPEEDTFHLGLLEISRPDLVDEARKLLDTWKGELTPQREGAQGLLLHGSLETRRLAFRIVEEQGLRMPDTEVSTEVVAPLVGYPGNRETLEALLGIAAPRVTHLVREKGGSYELLLNGRPAERYRARQAARLAAEVQDPGRPPVQVITVPGNTYLETLRQMLTRAGLRFVLGPSSAGSQTYSLAILGSHEEQLQGLALLKAASEFRDQEAPSNQYRRLRYLAGAEVRETLGKAVPGLDVLTPAADPAVVVLHGTAAQVGNANRLIDQLDRAPRQVRISGFMAEITPELRGELGLQNGKGYFDLSHVLDAAKLQQGIEQLQAKGRVRLVALPDLRVLDRHRADLFSGEMLSLPRAKGSRDRAPLQIGMHLGVEPTVHASPDTKEPDYVTLRLEPEVNSVSDSPRDTESADPRVRTRRAETTLRLQSGQAVLIGGLLTAEELSVMEKIPLLGDLPLLGRMFRVKHTTHRARELVLVLTATVEPGP